MLESAAAFAGLAQAVPLVSKVSRQALRRLRLFGTFEPSWLTLGIPASEFTAAEVSQIENFLGKRDTRSLLSLLALTLVTTPSAERNDAISTLQTTFNELAKRDKLDAGTRWYKKRDIVWSELVQMYDSATPSGGTLAEAADEFGDFLTTPIGSHAKEDRQKSRFARDLAVLCADIDRVAEAVSLGHDLRTAIAEAPPRPIITYSSATDRAAFDELYVNRSMKMQESGQLVDDLELMRGGVPYRRVLKGAPGAGKSTFVQHFRKAASGGDDGQPVLVAVIREYAQKRGEPILDHLLEDARVTYSIEAERQTMRDLLVLGHPIVVFDGLDEVTDLGRRAEMVSRIAAFASEYPAVSILVTSRAIGYERAPLPASSFKSMSLLEYSEAQSQEYVQRWFEFIGRRELASEFSRESVTVKDLISNPLLLSLLCILYRERGSIPRRRRDIYAECADLLFHTWDSHRHIDQPEELHANGDRIMQEIARWVYKSPSAQGGLSERVIAKTIGQYLEDHVGVAEGEARRRAEAFLDFCANRAWLLGVIGTERGERLFGFTHRTFLEYFAAEAFSRESRDANHISSILIEANAKDSTSVLPELLLQSYDQKVDRGAAAVFRETCTNSDDELLILRLMEGAPLPAKVRSIGFKRVLEIWDSRGRVSEPAFIQLLRINPDARQQFVSDFLKGTDEVSAGIFLAGWAAFDLHYGAAAFEAWQSSAMEVLTGAAPVRKEHVKSVELWSWSVGVRPSPPTHPASELYVLSASGARVGSLWIAVEMSARMRAIPESTDIENFIDGVLSRRLRAKSRIDYEVAHRFASALPQRLEATGWRERKLEFESTSGESAFLYLMCVLHEVSGWDEDFTEWIAPSLSEAARWLWASRNRLVEDDNSDSTTLAGAEDSSVPKVFRDWARGRVSFVKDR